MQAWEKAYWYFAGQDYLDKECEFYAQEFATYAVENLQDGITLDDLLNDFVGDVVFAERAEKEKERSRYA
jgi:hypothetical protein